MGDNQHIRGFRWSTGNNRPCPNPFEARIADAYQAQDDTTTFNVDLNPGDPLKKAANGNYELANTGDPVEAIMVAVSDRGVFDANLGQHGAMRPAVRVPGGTTSSGNIARQTYVLAVKAKDGYWEIDVDDKTTATTENAYRNLVGKNADHACPGVQADKHADPKLDVSTAATTESLGWRIEGVSTNRKNEDFSGANVALIVRINESEEAGAPATRVTGT